MSETKVSAEDLLKQKKELVENIRTYCRSQRALWRMVPYLALNANGRTGYSNTFQWAYEEAFWPIQIPTNNVYRIIFIDLRSGEIVNAYHYQNNPRPLASDDDVFGLAKELDNINAKLVVEALKQKTKQDHLSCYNPETQRKWRLEKLPQIIKLMHTKPSYINYEEWRELQRKEEKPSIKPQ